MKNIGILTFHYLDNYGTVLQCYALRTAINRLPDCHAEIINYKPPSYKEKYYSDKKLQKKYIQKRKLFTDFGKEYIGISDSEINDTADIDLSLYDGYVSGSDQIWNMSFSIATTAYFLDFVKNDSRKIAYAASVGLPLNHPLLKSSEVFKDYIPRFDFISVRENTHVPFIQQFTDKKVEHVIDPALLLKSKDYDSLITRGENKGQKFIFLYFLKHDNTAPLVLSFANWLSRKYNLKVVHFFLEDEIPDKLFKEKSDSFYFEGPRDFLWYIKNAEIVISNSFHATVFAILYKKPFYTYVVQSMASRLTDLLGELHLEDRLIYGYKKLETVSFDIDYNYADKVLESARERSLQLLRDALR